MSYLTKTSPMKCFCRAMKHVASLSSGNVYYLINYLFRFNGAVSRGYIYTVLGQFCA